MTSIPVKDLGFGLNGLPSAPQKDSATGGFRDVWNVQSGKEVSGQTKKGTDDKVEKTPGDSLKARDEYRARTKKREPIRNVEERADISEEKMKDVAETWNLTMNQLLEQVADRLGVTPEQLQASMNELGMETVDLLDNGALGQLILHISGTGDMTELVTNETLYSEYQELMDIVSETMDEIAGEFDITSEDLRAFLRDEEQKLKDLSFASENEIREQPEQVSDAVPVELRGSTKVDSEENHPASEENSNTNPAQTEPLEADTNVDKDKAGDKEGRQDNEKEGIPNLVLQTAKNGQFDIKMQEVQEAGKTWDTNTREIMNQIMDYMKVNLKGELSDIEMQLHPASLGNLQIQIASKGGVITANFVTQNETVKAILESQMIQLKNQFEEQGVKVEAIEVTVQTHEFERNLDQGRGNRQSGQEPSRKTRVRKIDLNNPIQSEEFFEEDELARSMMEAGGNTVDYTA